MTTLTPARIAMFLGAVSAALILGALAFQYIGHYPPCELCMLQRYPHFAAIAVGLGGGLLAETGLVPRKLGMWVAIIAALLVAATGVIGIYHAGVEWQWWKGPSTCTGAAIQLRNGLDLSAPVVSCDHAAWRLLGISMAGYNAIISVGAAVLGLAALAKFGKA